MDKKKILKIVGVCATVVGAGAFYFSGVTADSVGVLVAGTFTAIAIVVSLLK